MAVPPLSKRDKLPFSKRATMERLPIHLDPGMWKPEELMEVFRTPKLLEMLRADPSAVKLLDGNEVSRFDAGLRALQKAGIKLKDLLPRGPEGWLEHGTFLLMSAVAGALGVYRTREHAERARNRLVSDLANGVLPKTMSDLKNRIRQQVVDNALFDYWPDHPEFEESDYGWVRSTDHSDAEVARFTKVEGNANEQADREVERLFHPAVGRRARQEYAERTTGVVPLPIQLDDKDYAEADTPTEAEQNKARQVLRDNADATFKTVMDDKDFRNGWDAAEEFAQPAIDTVVKRLKAIEEGLDPDKMSDDGARHAATRLLPMSKQAAHPYRTDAKEAAREAHKRLRELATILGAPEHSGWWFGRNIEDLYTWIAINAPKHEPAAKHLSIEAGSSDKRLEKRLEGELHRYERFGSYSWEPDAKILERDIAELPKNEWYEHFCDDKVASIGLPISKRAQDPVRRTAESILKIINFLLFRVAPKDKARYLQRIKGKILKIPAGQVSLKKLPPTAAIGQSLALVKNILSGLNPFFVQRVVKEVSDLILQQAPTSTPRRQLMERRI